MSGEDSLWEDGVGEEDVIEELNNENKIILSTLLKIEQGYIYFNRNSMSMKINNLKAEAGGGIDKGRN